MKPAPSKPRVTSAGQSLEYRLKQIDNLQGEFMRHLQIKPDDLEGAAQLLAQLQRARKTVPKSHWLRIDSARLDRCRAGEKPSTEQPCDSAITQKLDRPRRNRRRVKARR